MLQLIPGPVQTQPGTTPNIKHIVVGRCFTYTTLINSSLRSRGAFLRFCTFEDEIPTKGVFEKPTQSYGSWGHTSRTSSVLWIPSRVGHVQQTAEFFVWDKPLSNKRMKDETEELQNWQVWKHYFWMNRTYLTLQKSAEENILFKSLTLFLLYEKKQENKTYFNRTTFINSTTQLILISYLKLKT